MGADNISYLQLSYLLVLIIPIFAISRKLGIHNVKKTIISMTRMVVQLSLVGLYLQYIFDMNEPILTLLYLILMMVVASVAIGNATPLKTGKVIIPIVMSLLLPNILMLLFFNGLVVQVDQLFEAKYLITIGGMLLGNGLNGNIIGLSTFYSSLVKRENEYRYALSLGASHIEAIMPYMKDAVVVSINPTIASMATIGLVSLPGMMTGQILGGSVPMQAIMYQIAIMIAIFVTKFFNIVLAIVLTKNRMFTEKLQINKEFLA